MEVNRKSWHYKFHCVVADDYSKNYKTWTLCSYFWSVVIGILISLIAVFTGCIVLYGLASSMWHYPLRWCIGVAAVILLVAAVYGILRFVWFWRDKNFNESDSLIIQYIVAKKRKFCPIIEFKG